MSKTMPTRIDVDLLAAAKTSGERNSRSAIQQIHHWARIGQQIENATALSRADIERTLAGQGSYDALDDREQAVVRAAWDESIAARIDGLDFAAEFSAAADTWTTGDDDGTPIVRTGTDTAPAR